MANASAKAVTMQLKVHVGTNENGSAKYSTRSISGINPKITNDDFLKLSKAFETLLDKPVSTLTRVDSAEIYED